MKQFTSILIKKFGISKYLSKRSSHSLGNKYFTIQTQSDNNNTNYLSNSCNNNRIVNSKSKSWSVLFFGTGTFALESLRTLQQEYKLRNLVNRLEVVTLYKGDVDEVIKFSSENHIKIHRWPINFSLGGFDIGIVVSFGHLIPSSIINSFPLGMVNVHASLLPRWRGAAPIIYSLLSGDTKTGVTIMRIKPKKYDIGEILAQQIVDIGPDETQPELHKKLAIIGAESLVSTIEELPDILNKAIPQSDEGLTHAPKITRSISTIKWSEMNAMKIYNLQRALTGIYPLTSKFYGKTIKLYGIKMINDNLHALTSTADNNLSHVTPGLMVFDKKFNLLKVQCRDGEWVSIEKITLPNRKRMTAKEFDNGFIRNKKMNKVILET